MRSASALRRSLRDGRRAYRGLDRCVSDTLDPGPPSGPSCSRWFSCSCCRTQRPPTPNPNFFTSTLKQIPLSSPPTLCPTRVAVPRPMEPLKATRFPLPLPPTLPYSPKSVPFQRHLEVLAWSLTVEPKTSWYTYEALHPDLRRHIPDQIFCDLIRHQLEDGDEVRRDGRIGELLVLASQCKMSFKLLDKITLEAIVNCRPKRMDLGDQLGPVFMSVWQALAGYMENDLSTISYRPRYRWLGRIAESIQDPDDMPSQYKKNVEAYAALKSLTQLNGAEKLHQFAKPILIWKKRKLSDAETWIEALNRFAELSTLGLCHQPDLLRRILEHLTDTAGKDKAQKLVDDLIVDLRIIGTEDEQKTAQIIESDWRALFMTRVEKVEVLIQSGLDLDVRRLTRKGLSALHDPNSTPEEGADAAIELLERMLDGNKVSLLLINRIITQLFMVDQLARPQRVLNLLRIFFDRDLIPLFSITAQARLLRVTSQTTGIYAAARKLYSIVRSADPPLRWNHHLLYPSWAALFYKATSDLNPSHFHFASRLYADSIADGRQIRGKHVLRLIKMIGRSSSESRLILLERHVKDYLYLNLGPKMDLTTAIVEGLRRTRSIDDAWLAFTLAMRIEGILPDLAEKLLEILISDKSLENVSRCIAVLAQVKTPKYWTKVMRTISTEEEALPANQENQHRLAFAKQVYDMMVSRSIQPKDKFLSLLIREIAQADHLEVALSAYNRCKEAGINIEDRTTATFIIRLAMAGRLTRAEEISSQWTDRYMNDPSRNSDSHMAGAMAFLYTKLDRPISDIPIKAKESLDPYINAANGKTVGVIFDPVIESSSETMIKDESDVIEESQEPVSQQQHEPSQPSAPPANALNLSSASASLLWRNSHVAGLAFI